MSTTRLNTTTSPTQDLKTSTTDKQPPSSTNGSESTSSSRDIIVSRDDKDKE